MKIFHYTKNIKFYTQDNFFYFLFFLLNALKKIDKIKYNIMCIIQLNNYKYGQFTENIQIFNIFTKYH